MALTPAIWVNMPDQLKQRSVNAARERFFPRMEYLLEDLGQIFA